MGVDINQAYTATEGSKADRGRKNVRYWLARIRTEVSGGAPAEGVPEGMREQFESMPMFQVAGGWMGYRVNWDVGPEGREMIGLEVSQWEAWHDICFANAKELPESAKVEAIREDKVPFKQNQIVDALLDVE